MIGCADFNVAGVSMAAQSSTRASSTIRLGLGANWQQFSLLVLINAFVGGMVGLERTIVPLLGPQTFHIASATVVAAFVIGFGIVKAFTNLISGQLADSWGRKRVLVLGWLVGLPVPFIIMWAPHWEWIVAANALLGINQGFAWSYEDRSRRAEVARIGCGHKRVCRLSGRWYHRIPDRLYCAALWTS